MEPLNDRIRDQIALAVAESNLCGYCLNMHERLPLEQAEARHGIAHYFDFYNHERLRQALDYRTPRRVFEEAMSLTKLRRGTKTAGAERQAAAE